MDFETIDSIIDINYIGAVNVAYLSKPILEKTKGMLINFASSSYTRGRANYALYSSSKAAIVNLTQALSEEWENIRVNCINPERTKTPMREKNFGYESEDTLLKAKDVAIKTLKVALSDISGIVVDVKR
jgi:2-C-methyl-D-erythritol 4-phosphate cytidylyltransferase